MGLVSPDGSSATYDTREVILPGWWTARQDGASSFAGVQGRLRPDASLTGFARLGGFAVGVVANQRTVIKSG